MADFRELVGIHVKCYLFETRPNFWKYCVLNELDHTSERFEKESGRLCDQGGRAAEQESSPQGAPGRNPLPALRPAPLRNKYSQGRMCLGGR